MLGLEAGAWDSIVLPLVIMGYEKVKFKVFGDSNKGKNQLSPSKKKY